MKFIKSKIGRDNRINYFHGTCVSFLSMFIIGLIKMQYVLITVLVFCDGHTKIFHCIYFIIEGILKVPS